MTRQQMYFSVSQTHIITKETQKRTASFPRALPRIVGAATGEDEALLAPPPRPPGGPSVSSALALPGGGQEALSPSEGATCLLKGALSLLKGPYPC